MPSFRNIHGLVGIARSRLDWSWRLRWFLGVAAWGAGAILLAALVTRVVPRLALPAESPVWLWLTGAALLAAVAAGIAAPFRRPRGPLSDAILVDTRLSLRDRLGTALALEGATEPFALAAQDDGERTAGRSELRGKVAAAFAVKPPEHWWLAPSLAAAAVVAVLWMPQLDPWSRKKPEDPEEVLAARQAAESDVQAVVKKIEENDALAKALKEAVAPESKDAPKDGARADEIRRDAARKVEQLAQKLDELLKGDEAAKLEALKNQLASLSLPQSKELQKFGEALKQGDFARAKEAMAELEKALAAGSLSEEQKEALAKALEKMAEQLKSSEAARKAAEDALAKAGLDPALAANQQALQQAIQNSQNLTQAQKEALQKALAAQQAASQARQQMAQSLQQMASQCKGGSQGQQGSKPGSPGQGSQGGQSGQKPGQGQQAGSGMGGMLSDLEAAQLMMCQAEAARNAASQCKGGGMCQSPGNSLVGGNNRAQASGARAEGAPSPTKTKLEQAKGTGAEADVIARQLVEGQSIVGEAQSKLQRLAGEIRPGFEEGTNEDPTPADRVEAQRHYFGQVKKLIEAKSAAPPAAAGGGAAPAKGGG